MSLPRTLLLSGAGLLLLPAAGRTAPKTPTPKVASPSGCVPAPASSRTVNVRDPEYGAKADGGDDTLAIQKALDAIAATGGTVWIPEGTYLVNPLQNATDGNHGLTVRSNTTVRLAKGAVLKAIPCALASFALIQVTNARNVNFVGGTIEGERSTHRGATGEWGMGITLLNAQDVVVEGLTAKECWGDGFYVGGTKGCSNIRFCRVTADHNRRQGISIVNADNVVIQDSTFKNTAGTAPEFGVDLEPNENQHVSRVLVKGCTFTDNAGGGFWGGPPFKARLVSSVTDSVVENCTFKGNGAHRYNGAVVGFSACTGNSLRNNIVTGNVGVGIMLRSEALNHRVTGNYVTGTQGDGIRLEDCAGSVVSGNTVMGNTGYGIKGDRGHGATVEDNTVSGNGRTP